jgi:hypothetical protein
MYRTNSRVIESSRIVVGNLAGDMMENVSFRDTVCSVSTDPGHDFSAVTEKVPVQSGQGTSGEGELWSTVMGEERVGVLQESDQYQPVVDPRMRL